MGDRGTVAKGDRVSFWSEENILKLTVVLVVRVCLLNTIILKTVELYTLNG